MTYSTGHELWGGAGRVGCSLVLGVGTGETLNNNQIGYAVMAVAFLAIEVGMYLRRLRLAGRSVAPPAANLSPETLDAIRTAVSSEVGTVLREVFDRREAGEGRGTR